VAKYKHFLKLITFAQIFVNKRSL